MDSRSSDASGLPSILGRLSQILSDENAVLESGHASDHSIFILGKNQLLKELMLVQKVLDPTAMPPALVDQLKETRRLVDRNHGLLRAQVSAVSEITDLLTGLAISVDNDGTYTRNQQ